jgi:hypothetical protein
VVAGGREIDHAGAGEEGIVARLAAEFGAAEAHRNFSAPCRDNACGRNLDGVEQVGKRIRGGLDQVDMRLRRHRLRHFDVDSGFDIPSGRCRGRRTALAAV